VNGFFLLITCARSGKTAVAEPCKKNTENQHYVDLIEMAALFLRMRFFFLQAGGGDAASNYLPIGIQLIFAIGFIATMMFLTHYFGPKRKTSDKLQNFESGIDIKGNARQPMAIKYFLVAILFVLFDVEVIFFYPYAVNFRELGWQGFFAVMMFVGLFVAGFVYIIKKGALKWED
jgi:NADH-quinone oxidoreductase subunit A